MYLVTFDTTLVTGVTMDPGGVQPRPDSALSERYTYMSKLKDKPKEMPLESNPPTYEEHVKRRTDQSTPSPTNTSLSLGQGAPEGRLVLQDDQQNRGIESEEEGYLKPTSSRKTAAVKPAPRVDGGTQMEMATLQNLAHASRPEYGQNLGQNALTIIPGQDDMRAGQLQPVPMGLLLRDRQGVPNSTPAASDGHLVLRQPGDRRSVQGVENVAYHQYEELPNREVDVGGVVLGVRGHGGGSDGPQESPYAQIGDLDRSSKRKPNPLYVSGRPARRRSIEKGSNGLCSRCQDQWRGYLIPALLFLFCVVALLLALLALTNAVSHQGVADQGADPGSTAAQTGDTWNTSVLTTQLAAALDRIQHLEIQNQQLAAQLSVLDNQTMVRQDDLQNQLTELERKQNTSLQNLSNAVGRQNGVLQATVQQISTVQDTLQTELSQLNSSVMAELDTVSKMEGPHGFNGSQGAQGPSGPVGPAGPSGVSRLDDCEFWDHSSTSDFLGPTELDWLRPEANHTMMGVHCATEGGTYTLLEHRDQGQGVSEYRCVCYGEVTDKNPNIDFQSRKCTINWWMCPTT
ncbi:uncharacterized protein LOC118410063 isoform X2 [Branchiostoma floridae]|uniref:Uncharacterized protein LOC118410063 isoform X2 n=1 Tax=Branchiostoma floridae TaxID=7739 RepID=A0A9J7MH13_BRAFL|nr:uncharacterized protein LOC118410063 isoform X2 [Branchiostoma floridae]